MPANPTPTRFAARKTARSRVIEDLRQLDAFMLVITLLLDCGADLHARRGGGSDLEPIDSAIWATGDRLAMSKLHGCCCRAVPPTECS